MTDKNTQDISAAIDARLEAALDASNYRITLSNQRAAARLKLQQNLNYSINGGIFCISTELISFVGTLISRGRQDAVLLDVNKNPIEIPDLEQFLTTIIDIYYESTNDFLVEFKSIARARTTAALVGIAK